MHKSNGSRVVSSRSENGGRCSFHIHLDTRRYHLVRWTRGQRPYLAWCRTHENWEYLHTAGPWSRWLLWNKPVVREAIRAVRPKGFNLKVGLPRFGRHQKGGRSAGFCGDNRREKGDKKNPAGSHCSRRNHSSACKY